MRRRDPYNHDPKDEIMHSNSNHTSKTLTRTIRRTALASFASLLMIGATVTGAHADRGTTPRPPTAPAGPAVVAAGPESSRPTGPTGLAGLAPSGFSITDVKVGAHGTYVGFLYTTNAPSVTVRVTPYKPVFENGVWSDPILDSIYGAEAGEGAGTRKFYKQYLDPATTYYYIISAPTTVDQIPVQAVGTFTTLHRTVTVTLDAIHVTDDSDPGLKGDGDFTFWTQIDGVPTGTFSKDIASDSSFAIDLDGKGAITRVFPELAVGHDIDVQVQVFENDVQSWDWCSGFLTGGKEWDGKAIDMENDCGTWLELHTTYDSHVSSNKVGYGFQETEPIEFTMGSGDSSVHMTITGTVTTVWS